MTDKKRKFFSGSSLEAALVAAASEYGIPVDEVAYEVVEKKHGFLRVRRNVVIRIDPDNPRRAEDAPPAVEPEPAGRRMPPAPPRQQDDEEDDQDAADETDDEPEDDSEEADDTEPEDVEDEDDEEDSDEEDSEDSEDEDGDDEDEDEEEVAAVEPPGGRRRRRAPTPEPEDEEDEEEDDFDDDEEDEDEDGDDEDDEPRGRGDRRRGRRRRHRRRAPRPEEPKPIPPIEKRLQKAKGKLADAALESTDWLLDLLDLDVDAEVYKGDDRLEVEIRGRDREKLIDEEGKALSALEHLIPRVMHGVLGETTAIRVDSENFQEGREERLRQKAMQMAFEVRESGKAEVLEPMDPADRRIVHLAVNDEAGVGTKSLGGGFYKRVKIYPD